MDPTIALPKRAEEKKQEGSRKRGRPQLRWEDCVKRDLRKAEEEEKWREKANNRDRWKQITKVAVLSFPREALRESDCVKYQVIFCVMISWMTLSC